MTLEEVMNNPYNVYLGHGTRAKVINDSEKNKIESIFNLGLRCCHGYLQFTTITLGLGEKEYIVEAQKLLNNWPHMSSKVIVITSFPTKYFHLRGSIPDDQACAYLYVNDNVLKNVENKEGTRFLRPEFVRGVFDVTNQQFIENKRYYENLSEEEQKVLFQEVKKAFITPMLRGEILASDMKGVWECCEKEFPLSDSEIKEIDEIVQSNLSNKCRI